LQVPVGGHIVGWMSNQGDGSDEPDRDAATYDDAREPEPADGDGDSFTFQDEHEEAFGKPDLRHVTDDEDGMPKPMVDDVLQDAHVPPFLPESNQICVADLRQFVVRDDDWGDIIASFPPSHVKRAPDGRYRVRLWGVPDALVKAWGDERFVEMYGEPIPAAQRKVAEFVAPLVGVVTLVVAMLLGANAWVALLCAVGCTIPLLILQLRRRTVITRGHRFPEYVEVEPIRPVCAHYLEQLEPPPASMAHVLTYGNKHRYCTVKRSTAGAFFGLKDEAMRACSMRSPSESRSLDLLEQFDIELAEKSRSRTHLPMFKLQDEKDDPDLAAYRAAVEHVLAQPLEDQKDKEKQS
jgi:hypothetical protein